ncbi:aminotransferase class IV [Salininema proteolyticum]|uniref:Aminotransferase class IV n=1 Tax=Salininema proteolyticum TaxID=1607685 RepID=A0ABV8U1R3_9ACTN
MTTAQSGWRTASPEDLEGLALGNFGHFTSMQVRGGRARGFAKHLERLAVSSEELFGRSVPEEGVRNAVVGALAGRRDASIRVTVFGGNPDLVVWASADEPAEAGGPLRLMTVAHVRPAPHVKHTGTFAQTYYGRKARAEGFNDALFATEKGLVSETAIANVGFWDGAAVVWPEAPQLPGITMALIREGLEGKGVPQTRRPVGLGEIRSFHGMFACNSLGISAVEGLDGRPLPVDEGLMELVNGALESRDWEDIEAV